jgi:hypothetical protein
MMHQIFMALIPGLINGLIILPLASIFLGFYLSVSLESKLALFSIALILVIIILILRYRFAPERVRVVKTQVAHHTYLIQKNVARHIPDAETFDYLGEIYGFHWGTIETVSHDSFIKRFSVGSMLPSIRPHCKAFCDAQREQSLQNEN